MKRKIIQICPVDSLVGDIALLDDGTVWRYTKDGWEQNSVFDQLIDIINKEEDKEE